jgi:hypothetical protein
MPQYRKKPIVIDAVQNDGTWKTIIEWMKEQLIIPFGSTPPITRNEDGSLNIRTLEGTMRADVGDWVIKGIKGELYPCKPEIFEASYEPVPHDA